MDKKKKKWVLCRFGGWAHSLSWLCWCDSFVLLYCAQGGTQRPSAEPGFCCECMTQLDFCYLTLLKSFKIKRCCIKVSVTPAPSTKFGYLVFTSCFVTTTFSAGYFYLAWEMRGIKSAVPLKAPRLTGPCWDASLLGDSWVPCTLTNWWIYQIIAWWATVFPSFPSLPL